MSYTGGDVVSGMVYLHCLVPFVARGVIVKVKGYETSAWEEWKEKPADKPGEKPHRYLETHRESHEFFKTVIRVYPHEGQVLPGQYSFPFQYQLPPNLPGTYSENSGNWGNGHAYQGEIMYAAQAKVDVAFKHDLKKKICFVVNEKFDRSLAPSFGENSKTFMFTKGRLTAKVSLNQNCYFPGNTVIARMEANNTSVKPTTKVTIRVMKHLELQAQGHRWERNIEIHKEHKAGFEPSFFGIKWFSFGIPVNTMPSTTSSKLVRCHYYFVIDCDIPGALDLSVKLPTAILAPQWLWSAHPPQPPPATLPADISFRPPWQPDEHAAACNNCKAGFSLFNRRHHCRHCGKVFCGKCCSKQLVIANLGYGEPVLVCDPCFPTAQSGGHLFQTAPTFVPATAVEIPPTAPLPSAPPAEFQASAPPPSSQ